MRSVYHASRAQGLTVIEPRISTHGETWVYAAERPEISAMFLGTPSDLLVASGLQNGMPHIAERLKGGLERAYKNQQGSIYTLDGTDFHTGRTSFLSELVCDHACPVLAEEQVGDALEHLLQLEAQGKIEIYRYPNLPPWLPKDKSDLIEKIPTWRNRPTALLLQYVRELHPDILEAVQKKLEPDAHEIMRFVTAESIDSEVNKLFEAEKAKLAQVLPHSTIEHIGSTAVPGSLTKGDLDINVRVRAEDFKAATQALEKLYAINQLNNWTSGFASFKDDARNLGVQLTVIGSPDDMFVAQREYFRAHPEETQRYNALKQQFEGKTMEAYRAAKDVFLRGLDGTL
jgi:GrpB-like predicted nucleotidyltransferase (UPF0157 family)